MEDPSNETTALTLPDGKVMEVEYNFQMTAFAVDAAYCLRSTDGGTALDNYSRVAEVTILHAPIISNFSFNDDRSVALTEGTTTRIFATGTVSDLNGYADIVAATGTYWRSGVSGTNFCSANDNNCYQIASTSCTLSACAGNSCTLACSAFLQFFADPTDIGTYASEQWDAKVDVWDTSNSHRTATSGEELFTLRAISMPADINYGSVVVGTDTGSTNASTSVTNTGNSQIDLLVSGTDMTSGPSTIAAEEQKFATSTFTYSSCTLCAILSTTTQAFPLGLAKPTTTVPVLDRIYWGIRIPSGTAATVHSGSNTFIAN
ncbi:MAG TPA: hypothetical protein VLB83_00765 [Candidatus Paceibacterota bacterium]|nr:hypothetical protein [Candidatus Paceibacterota bacterium]